MLDVMEGKVYDKHFVPGKKKKNRSFLWIFINVWYIFHTLFWTWIIEVCPWQTSKIQFHHCLLRWTSGALVSLLSNVIFQVFSLIKPWGSKTRVHGRSSSGLCLRLVMYFIKKIDLDFKKFTLLRYPSDRKFCCQTVFLVFCIPAFVYLTLLDLEKKMHWARRVLFTVQIWFSPVLVVPEGLNTFRSSLMAVQNYTLCPVTGGETPKTFLTPHKKL